MEKLNERGILRAAIKEQDMKQVELAKELNTQQNSLSAKMTRERMSVDTFKRVLNVPGYDVVVIEGISGEQMWMLDMENK